MHRDGHWNRLGLVARAVLVIAVLAAPRAARAQTWTATLTGPNESPPNSSPATGHADVTLNGNNLTVNIFFSGLTAPSTASHIHCCTSTPLTGTAGIATAVPTFPGFPLGVTSGSYSNIFDLSLASSYNPAFITANGGTVSSAEAAFLQGLRSGDAYLNVHSTAFPSGEIRGFLVTTTPEPSSMVLLGSGLVGLGGVARRRLRRNT